jgi:Cysteine-rich CWC
MSDQGAVCTIEKICQRCAATFECRSSGCWCNNVRLSAAKLKWLEKHYENCLCPACLASIESC